MALRYLILAFCIAFVAGCGTRQNAVVPPPAVLATVSQQGGMFSDFGELKSNDGAWVVKTTRRSKSLVDYAICDASTGTVLAQGGGFSNAMRWFMYWDQDNRLWVHNSDMGPFQVWVHDGKSFSSNELAAGDALLDSIPDVVAQGLPKSVAKRLNMK